MRFSHVSFRGPPIDDGRLLAGLPENLQAVLRSVNGFILYDGGLHIRGASLGPSWHSLRAASEGNAAFHALYEQVRDDDIPFGQDCIGDQFLLRNGVVHRLFAETGDVEITAPDLNGFFEAAEANPVEYLGLQPLLNLLRDGRALQPGELVHAYPPFCTEEAARGVSLRP